MYTKIGCTMFSKEEVLLYTSLRGHAVPRMVNGETGGKIAVEDEGHKR